MNRVPDRKKLRREYLNKRRRVYFERVLCLIVSSLVGAAVYHTLLEKGHLQHSIRLFAIVAWLLILVVSFLSVLKEAQREASEIPVVPPVTPDTLPAEEVLVRGAEEPQAGRETLVRPATATEETPAQQLLRSSQTGDTGPG